MGGGTVAEQLPRTEEGPESAEWDSVEDSDSETAAWSAWDRFVTCGRPQVFRRTFERNELSL